MKKSTANFLMGVLAGAAVGAVAGILFAPEKGSTTRDNIKRKVLELAEEYGIDIEDLVEEIKSTGHKTSGKGEKKAAEPERKKRKYARKTKPETEQ